MNQHSDSDDILRRLDTLASEADHTDEESRAVLAEAGVEPTAFARSVRGHAQTMLAIDRLAERRNDPYRYWVLGISAAAVAAIVTVLHLDYRADAAARRDVTRAQLIGPLLPSLASDDPETRSIALVVARQVDADFAEKTSVQLTQWEATTQAQARASRNAIYAARFVSGLQKLQLSRDPDDRKAAIWNDLLPVLLDARKNRDDFVDIAIQYERVLPLLRVKNPDVFLDSYWGELWILSILLESKIAPVVDAAKQQAPEPAVVQQIFQKNAPGLADRDRRAFEEAVTVYASSYKGLR
jgi:hypothetical protein